MKNSKIVTLSLSVLVSGVIFSGCAEKNPQISDLEQQLQHKTELLSKQQKEVSQQEAEIRELNKKLQTVKSTTASQSEVVHTSTNDTATNDTASLTPPNAKLGECYAKVLIPAQYTTDTTKRLLKSKEEKLRVVPATYKNVEYKILDRAASFKYITKPATYKCVSNRVMVAPEKTAYKVIPATYKKVSEKVLVSKARKVWKKGHGPITRVNHQTGDIMCLVEIPAQYKTVTKTVVDKPAHVEKVVIPAKYKNIRAKVVEHNATYEKVVIPAKYKVVRVEELNQPAKVLKSETKDIYQTVKTKRLVKPEELRWERILCKTNTSKNLIKNLQRELKKRKYYRGRIDGKYNARTQEALNRFQIANHLSSGALTLESLEKLNLK
jgi:hypothetical protein